ncbi:hypothetical protein BGZ82_009135 [Podila clonocystis]|nr:hypothetical protein BGZ82_009135 [Podila clonocystis]
MRHYFDDHSDSQARTTVDGVKIEEPEQWIGNPVFDPALVSLLQELKARSERLEEVPQAKRRTAIGYDDMAKLMRHLQKPETIEAEGAGRCLLFQAFAAVAFTLWLTYDEALQIKRGYIRVSKMDTEQSPYCEATLPFRASNPIGPSQANVYEIHPRPNAPHACCVIALNQWIQWIEHEEGGQLQADDYLFPEVSRDNEIQLEESFSIIRLTSLMNQYAHDAALMHHRHNHLDTHCFRRGGAQYRLIHAQDPWLFQAVKWREGFSEKELSEKLVEYLLDDSQYETSLGGILSLDVSKAQGHTATVRPTTEVPTMESGHATELARIRHEIQEIRREHGDHHQELKQENRVLRQEISELRSDLEQPPTRPYRSSKPSQKRLPRQQPPPTVPQQRRSLRQSSLRASHVIPGISIWKEAIRQWDDGDPEQGLTKPLSQWTTPMIKRNPSTYNERRKIAQEFEFFGRDENRMREAHGNSMDGVTRLLESIRRRCSLQRRREEEDDSEEERCQDEKDGSEYEEAQPEERKEEQEDDDDDDDDDDEEHDDDDEEDDDDDEEAEEKEGEDEEAVEQDKTNRKAQPIPIISNWKEAIQQWEEGDPDNGLTMKKEYGNNMDGVRKLMKAIHNRRKRQKAEGGGGGTRRGRDSVDNVDDEDLDDGEDADKEGSESPPNMVVPRIHNWKQALRQWEKGDPENGLIVPIRDWPPEWRRQSHPGGLHKLYYFRQFIAEEFEFCGRDENRMRELHGKNMGQIKAFVRSIRKRRMEMTQQEKADAPEDENRDDENEEDNEEIWVDVLQEEVEKEVKKEVKNEDEEDLSIRKRRSKAVDDTKASKRTRHRPFGSTSRNIRV